jgi:prepilin-type N-terminal cleavage/methylation domain-containing protein
VRSSRRRAFTLVELMVVIGVIAVLIGLLLPTISGARKQAKRTACLANLRSIGQGWNIYLAENKQNLPYLFWYAGGANPDLMWHGFWGGILADQGMPVWKLICPEAKDPMPGNLSGGFGAAYYCWTGQYNTAGTVIRYPGAPLKPWNGKNPVPGAYRVGSYGFNNHCASPSTYGSPIKGTGRWGRKITHIRNAGNVPMFVDAVWPHVEVYNWAGQTETSMITPPGMPVALPSDLYGKSAWSSGATQHWRFLIARHHRGINMLTADSSARWAPLEEVYLYQWDNDPAQQEQGHRGWTPYKLNGLPAQ